MRVLIVEDDHDLAQSIKQSIQNDYVVEIASSATQALTLLSTYNFDLLLLDLNLPDKSGIKLFSQLKLQGIATPAIMITADSLLSSKISAFNSGFDDYLVKPFDCEELKARMKAILKRSVYKGTPLLKTNEVMIDVDKRLVTRGSNTIQLRKKEFDILVFLLRYQNKVVSRNMIFEHVWHPSSDSYLSTVDVHIKYLRDKIDKNYPKKIIKTIYGTGYKLES